MKNVQVKAAALHGTHGTQTDGLLALESQDVHTEGLSLGLWTISGRFAHTLTQRWRETQRHNYSFKIPRKNMTCTLLRNALGH